MEGEFMARKFWMLCAAIVLLVNFGCAGKAPLVIDPVTGKAKDPAIGMEMVYIKGGCYQMGATFGVGGPEEKPVHEVCVDDFYVGKYEVTQGQWKSIMGTNPSHFATCGDNCPVDSVSWIDVQDFISRLNSRHGERT